MHPLSNCADQTVPYVAGIVSGVMLGGIYSGWELVVQSSFLHWIYSSQKVRAEKRDGDTHMIESVHERSTVCLLYGWLSAATLRVFASLHALNTAPWSALTS